MATPHRLLLLVFLVAQVCDGLFTYVAVDAFGVIAEGNQLLAMWIGVVGAGPAIAGAKLMAAGCGVLLYYLGVHRALFALTLLYGCVAIGPWLVTLHRI